MTQMSDNVCDVKLKNSDIWTNSDNLRRVKPLNVTSSDSSILLSRFDHNGHNDYEGHDDHYGKDDADQVHLASTFPTPSLLPPDITMPNIEVKTSKSFQAG